MMGRAYAQWYGGHNGSVRVLVKSSARAHIVVFRHATRVRVRRQLVIDKQRAIPACASESTKDLATLARM